MKKVFSSFLFFIFIFVQEKAVASSVIGVIKRLNGLKALVILDRPLLTEPEQVFRTSVDDVVFTVKKVSPKGSRIIGEFSGEGVVKKGMEVQFYDVALLAIDDEFEADKYSKNQKDEGFRIDDYKIHLYGVVQGSSALKFSSGSFEVETGVGAGAEFIQKFSFSNGLRFGISAGAEGLFPQSATLNNTKFEDLVLPLHIYSNFYYFFQLDNFLYGSLLFGLVASTQNFEHVSLPGVEMDTSIGVQFGGSLNYKNFEFRGFYRVTDHDLEFSNSKENATYNSVVFSLGYHFN